MLYAFLLKQKEKKSNNLTATYLVGGRSKVDEELVRKYPKLLISNLMGGFMESFFLRQNLTTGRQTVNLFCMKTHF
jgi:hypothetical protein